MWFSRQREFRADLGGAKLSGAPSMIAALQRIAPDGAKTHVIQPNRSWDFTVAVAAHTTTLVSTHEGSAAMGKPQFPTLSAGATARTQSQDSWMRDLQLQTVAVDIARWQPGARQAPMWHSFAPRTRIRRFH
jgi:hypothetical protein